MTIERYRLREQLLHLMEKTLPDCRRALAKAAKMKAEAEDAYETARQAAAANQPEGLGPMAYKDWLAAQVATEAGQLEVAKTRLRAVEHDLDAVQTMCSVGQSLLRDLGIEDQEAGRHRAIGGQL